MRTRWKMTCLATAMVFGVAFGMPNGSKEVMTKTVSAAEAMQETSENPATSSTWKQDEKGWQYFDESGEALSNGEKTVDGKTYYFDENGYLATGFHYVGKDVCYFDESGETPKDGLGVKNTSSGWKTLKENVYYFEKGNIVSGWKTIGKKKYYFNRSEELSKRGSLLTGFQNIGKNTYYFKGSGAYGTKGMMLTGWQTLNQKRYYFYSNGAMAKSTYIQGYQVTSSGALSNKAFALQKKVKSVVAAQTKKCKTKSEKLKACYMYVVKSFSYKRSYSFKKTDDWEMNYAYTMLTKKKGNCYNYASTFSFLARELGYNSKTITGMITAARGGFTPHSWVEIKMGKTTYLFDTEMQHAKGYDLYKKTYKSVSKRLTYKK